VQRRLRVRTRIFAALALLFPAACAMSGCSPASYPSIFPAVEETPPSRADTPMDANQVQQATEDLISDRNRLSTEAGGTGQSADPAAAATKPPAANGTGSAENAGGNGAQTAGAETK
jgi:hypothetical protein